MSKKIINKLKKLSEFLRDNNFAQESNYLIKIAGMSLSEGSQDVRLRSLYEKVLEILGGNRQVGKGPDNDEDLIKYIQRLLVKSGFSLPIHGVDGKFGPETEGAVLRFEKARGLSPTGVISERNLGALEEAASTSVPKKEESAEAEADSSGHTLYLGDSQMVGSLGNALVAVGGSGPRLAKVGVQASYWANNSELVSTLESGPSKIIISLNGNGISGTQSLIETIKEHTPRPPKVVWTGAPPAIRRPPGSTWADYLTTESGFQQAQARRRSNNMEVEAKVEAEGWTFLDPYEYIKLENGEPGYECSRCDGIHLPRDVAEEYVSKISGYL